MIKIKNFKENIDWDDYDNIRKWIQAYQRESDKISIKKVLRYANNDEFRDKNKKYVLYRGIYLRDEEGYIDSYDLKQIKKDKIFFPERLQISWTFNKNQAYGFAIGNKTWLDSKRELTSQARFYKHYGIILKQDFSLNEIIFDFNYIDKNNEYLKNIIDFPMEEEVIINPFKYKFFKIIELLE
ncbi:hypothetical protein LCGC14_1202290 [marine sediment metagenome]|uniref:Uncharacterized protein n=1 Tax=marine sediment metagenome TaxID=412755 RepID=A0A0F9LGJ7_9ZZZZ